MSKPRATYKEAGVDIEAGNSFVQKIKPLVKSTFRPEVMTEIGGFGGLFSLNAAKYKNPVLVSGTDGVGTKLKLAFLADRHDTVGIDLVAMCVNDIVVQGAEPLFFLDYLATGKLDPDKAAQIVAGIAEGCRQAGCALIGGETAEMPGFYADGEYDIAGFTVGVVEKDQIIDGSSITVGNKLIGIGSSGLHSNGYSLARRIIFDRMGLAINSPLPDSTKTVDEELLTPTRIYVRSVMNLLKDFRINGIAHITGGGLLENVPRILPKGCSASFKLGSWDMPSIFTTLQEAGNVEQNEMYRTFNMGIGMVLAVAAADVDDILSRLNGLGEQAWLIGEVKSMSKNQTEQVVLV
ncbi:phosphoribosylformylglycinamidine cyclo-ligase [Trichlorobacter lovleyi]|uniref:Phosphoribosylformylglycinamidine cyclo-ligase n=1 Tax=Trichlorobacter lovleyi (strain ATCC BAA-1151 / DSM 17278 / SZ) TaxID=398767 RepID=PUR5_TRIL1|nr:phosphoribosylformylglycinamidine cyclo-ligase [Trichlorobacter lovleyi]B3E3K3.1 RecName: Full=Phosphoribosylformylglycinamidine cyclo-ligase; AltName: Full=AIR synthase; AltName: Full=AIRS; AltName: Full=Phosphoribosyl-aminoimidazole synthetase [Trichlorobacter lovleyi SZ]ACD95822.1 phosphoribosylformylglycinamidine cyclo-ligase [Trichlorobacter lovleyi SZ]